jgi:hypothetical protein
MNPASGTLDGMVFSPIVRESAARMRTKKFLSTFGFTAHHEDRIQNY